MIADETPADETPEIEEPAAAPEAAPKTTVPEEAAAEPKPAAADEEPAEPAPPTPDPATCPAIAIGMTAFWESVLDGEWDGTEFQYYLEPAGITQADLKCTRAPEKDPERAGLLMTRTGWQAKTVFLDDGINPESYELTFPKEFGYVKPVAHYKPETREKARYPWSKKY